ncbi:hypothetical protein Cgig2_024429 [Carnegiea gigantea]|uniref:3-ketoacyl-CoA synthase n=1 Tax=Carnegiea gigantea TaxID=171969 RepID=A0A9Q1KKU8_9CARY|nr:hypothetical protein Cgig2_024429 [Carnegiea gigantea]
MSMKMENLSTEIVEMGVQHTGPYAGSPNFSIRVRRGLPSFLNSVNLKYVKLGYLYLVSHGFYLVIAPVVVLILGAILGKLTWSDFSFNCSLTNTLCLIGLLCVVLYLYLDFIPPPTYLVDFACYRPPGELQIVMQNETMQVSKEDFIELARKSGNFDENALAIQQQFLKSSGIGDETYLPKTIFQHGYKKSLKESREEAAMVMFGAIDDLLATTKIKPKDISILIVNCSSLSTTPSLSAIVINHYKLKHDICSFNLGGMGCSAGIIAIDLARDLLNVYPRSYALVVSTEIISYSWYSGKEVDMLIPNCFLRMGCAAILLSNHRLVRWKAKYELKQVVRTHKGMDNRSFNSVHVKEDSEGNQSISVSKDVMEIGGHALKDNITILGTLVLPLSEQLQFFTSLLNSSSKPYVPNYKLAFEHICIQATSKKVLDEIQKNLGLTEDYMEPSRKTLERFGNTSSSSVWYELACLEANKKVKRGDRIWQIAFGSGFKCNSAVWRAVNTIGKPKKSPWIEDSS